MSEFDYKKILDSIPQYYYIINVDSCIIEDSNDKNAILGKSCCYEMIFGLTASCDTVQSDIECICKDVVKKKDKVELTHRIKTDKGDRITKVTASPLFNDDEVVTHVILQYIDISKEIELGAELQAKNEELLIHNEELIEAKEELEQLKYFFENINESVQDGIWVSDKQDVIYYANPAMAKIAGISRTEIINKNVLQDFPE